MIIKHSFAMVERCEVHHGIYTGGVLLEQLLYGGGFYHN